MTPPGRNLEASAVAAEPAHYLEWIHACHGGPPATTNYAFERPIVESLMLGNIAIRTQELLEWDTAAFRLSRGSDRASALFASALPRALASRLTIPASGRARCFFLNPVKTTFPTRQAPNTATGDARKRPIVVGSTSVAGSVVTHSKIYKERRAHHVSRSRFGSAPVVDRRFFPSSTLALSLFTFCSFWQLSRWSFTSCVGRVPPFNREGVSPGSLRCHSFFVRAKLLHAPRLRWLLNRRPVRRACREN